MRGGNVGPLWGGNAGWECGPGMRARNAGRGGAYRPGAPSHMQPIFIDVALPPAFSLRGAHASNYRPLEGWLWAACGSFVGRLWSKCGRVLGEFWVNSG